MPIPDDSDDTNLGSMGGGLSDLAEDYVPTALPAGLLTPNGAVAPQPPAKRLAAMAVDNTVCLRGPCRHLMQATVAVEVESLDYDATAVERSCKAQPGVFLEIKEPTYVCSDWDPINVKDSLYQIREKRRATYLKSPEGIEAQRADAQRLTRRAEQRARIDAEAAERNRELDIQKAQKAIAVEAGDFEPQD